jgi:hypothetical protein
MKLSTFAQSSSPGSGSSWNGATLGLFIPGANSNVPRRRAGDVVVVR